MLFSSIPFLYFFLPAVILLYFISPKKLKNTVLLLASAVFYAWGEPKYIILMSLSVIIGYIGGILIEKLRNSGGAKAVMIVCVVINLGFLAFFKYADFFISNVNAVTGLNITLLRIALPIGISFYTFQILSYIIDVYRGNAAAQKNPVNFAMYVAFFPQLIAGPIVRYVDIDREISSRTHSFENFSAGLGRFITGLAKKVLIANALGELCDTFKSSDDKSVMFFWLYAAAFTLHIYFDFSGYSDMAIGLGRIFGFHFPENFNYPYISESVTEFWRRWHISLGTWFRDYVYIPLGGNRVSKPRQYFNILVVWMLTGFWHGADWNFIVWGLFFAVLLMIEKQFLLKTLKKAPAVLCHVYVMLAVIISFVIFNADSMSQAVEYIGAMFGAGNYPIVSTESIYYLKSYLTVIIFACVGAMPFVKNTAVKLCENRKTEKALAVIRPIVSAAMLFACTAYLVDGSFNPFLYFRF